MTSPEILCEDCRGQYGAADSPADGFHVQGLPLRLDAPAESRLRAVCGPCHRSAPFGEKQFVAFEDGWRAYVVQDVMES